MIIDLTDFDDRPYKVPNQEESRDFLSFIEKTEEMLAVKYLLGRDLWEEFQAALETSGVIDPHWLLLRDGGEYTYNTKTYHFTGWVDMVRPGIFALWLPHLTYKLTNVGYVVNSAPQQSELVDDQYQFHIEAWNEFVNKARLFERFMTTNKSDYIGWKFHCPMMKNRFDL